MFLMAEGERIWYWRNRTENERWFWDIFAWDRLLFRECCLFLRKIQALSLAAQWIMLFTCRSKQRLVPAIHCSTHPCSFSLCLLPHHVNTKKPITHLLLHPSLPHYPRSHPVLHSVPVHRAQPLDLGGGGSYGVHHVADRQSARAFQPGVLAHRILWGVQKVLVSCVSVAVYQCRASGSREGKTVRAATSVHSMRVVSEGLWSVLLTLICFSPSQWLTPWMHTTAGVMCCG